MCETAVSWAGSESLTAFSEAVSERVKMMMTRPCSQYSRVRLHHTTQSLPLSCYHCSNRHSQVTPLHCCPPATKRADRSSYNCVRTRYCTQAWLYKLDGNLKVSTNLVIKMLIQASQYPNDTRLVSWSYCYKLVLPNENRSTTHKSSFPEQQTQMLPRWQIKCGVPSVPQQQLLSCKVLFRITVVQSPASAHYWNCTHWSKIHPGED